MAKRGYWIGDEFRTYYTVSTEARDNRTRAQKIGDRKVKPRKGARILSIGPDRTFYWLRGKTVTEIRDADTNKAVYVPNEHLSTEFEDTCPCCGEPYSRLYGDNAGRVIEVTLPSNIRKYIDHHGL